MGLIVSVDAFRCRMWEPHDRLPDDLAKAMGVPTSQVSRLVNLSRLPKPMLEAFGNPAGIREGWGLAISALLDDPATQEAMLRRARTLAKKSPRVAAMSEHRALLAASVKGRKPAVRSRDEVVRGRSGRVVLSTLRVA